MKDYKDLLVIDEDDIKTASEGFSPAPKKKNKK